MRNGPEDKLGGKLVCLQSSDGVLYLVKVS
jgi:hypothetical protein